jgi:hypothetical protein
MQLKKLLMNAGLVYLMIKEKVIVLLKKDMLRLDQLSVVHLLVLLVRLSAKKSVNITRKNDLKSKMTYWIENLRENLNLGNYR